MYLEDWDPEVMEDTLISIDEKANAQSQVSEPRDKSAPLTERAYLLALSAAVGTALAGNDSLRTILQRCAEATVQHLGLIAAAIWTRKLEEHLLELQATAGVYIPWGVCYELIQVGHGAIGRIAQECQPYVTNAIADDPCLPDKAWAQRVGAVAFAGYPLIVENRLVGIMALFARRPFAVATLHTLSWVAGVMAMGIDRLHIADALARSIVKVVRSNKTLRRKHTDLDDLTYIASHDLTEPLRKLMIFSRRLPQDLGTDLPERAAKDLEFIVDAATRMRRLLESMFDLSRVNMATLHWEQVDLALLLDSARQASAPTIAATNAIITNDPLPTVWGDHDLLMQLYQHLLSNAIKFCAQPPPVIHLTATLQGLQVVLGVQDNGIGIHSAYHEHIFAPCKRLHGRGEYEGSGMGLAICRKIVERHGGNIWVESDLGQGAHVKFTLYHHTAPASLLEETLDP